ncbi:MAG: D-alanyl-D-alanine carboxypeptidase/D-alanyl-D-alanine-endopeptidase [Ignavibacteria bacterium]|nr:D-alanyl-D-alanine carboxypeptidase/D-alanyl-D-alanine-endopeptidase [Ignavibacteria bacterium]
MAKMIFFQNFNSKNNLKVNIQSLIGFRFILIVKLVIISFFIPSKAAPTADSLSLLQKQTPLKELARDIESILDNSDFSNSHIGISIQSLETGEYFFRLNESKNFIPASTDKLITTAAALEYLGKDFHFITNLFLDGTLQENGEFFGNIIIRGSGDPTISKSFNNEPTDIIDAWIKKMDSAGIKSLRGNIIGDDKYFDKNYYAPGWAWDDMAYPYSAQVNALAINDNTVDIFIQNGDSISHPAKIKISPENSYIRIINNIRTVTAQESAEISHFRESRTNIIELNGKIPLDTAKSSDITKYSVTVENPTGFFLNIFKERLEQHQIRFRGALLEASEFNEKIDYSKLTELCSYESKPLSEIIAIINKTSHNLASEMLLKTIGKETLGKGSFLKGIEQIKRFLTKNGIFTENVIFIDGSGLSRYNQFSPRYQVGFLSVMFRSNFKDIFIQSLAEPGQKGTLNRRMTRTRAEKNVHAKTGTMNNVSNLCGYVTTRDGETLAISIMMMGFTVPQTLAANLQDLICMRLASFSRK